jgi:hypothetical protein
VRLSDRAAHVYLGRLVAKPLRPEVKELPPLAPALATPEAPVREARLEGGGGHESERGHPWVPPLRL